MNFVLSFLSVLCVRDVFSTTKFTKYFKKNTKVALKVAKTFDYQQQKIEVRTSNRHQGYTAEVTVVQLLNQGE